MPGGRPKKYNTPEEAHQGRLASKSAYRQRNLEEERAKSRSRTRKAAVQACQLREQNASTVPVESSSTVITLKDGPSDSKKASPSVGFGRKSFTPVTPDLDAYFPRRYQTHISGVKELGWDLLKPIVKERVTLLTECEDEAIRLVQLAYENFYGISGLPLNQANEILDEMRGLI
ncbi:hypothetical protein M422DRAFT_53663 [Sphaerobolus stellatus SS14]|uniref:Uncharacterized protein n=1 Tax=Sphaerobolus stellatus (strain SS14) TaxID=990650 RepID=A0A0C9UZT6_SPHS4|nr:hypothetical protein M422DRAFT_53663 [Sphaerobolus stellatus SS14]